MGFQTSCQKDPAGFIIDSSPSDLWQATSEASLLLTNLQNINCSADLVFFERELLLLMLYKDYYYYYYYYYTR